jgi:hypothetical protein
VFTAAEIRAELRAFADRARAYLAERRAPATAFGALLGASLLVWFVLLIATGGDRTPQLATGGRVAAPGPAAEGGPAPGGGGPVSPGQGAPGLAPGPAGREERAGDTAAEETADDADATDAAHDAGDVMRGEQDERDEGEREGDERAGETQIVDLDGQCRVEVDASAARGPRAWEHPECEHAPVDPSRHDERWIVVVGSYSNADNAQREARRWADRAGHDPQLLWSSHYPSLNPDLWVVYEGPYEHRHAATVAARELGPGAYLRLLTVEGPSDQTPPIR